MLTTIRWIPFRQSTAAQLHALTTYMNRNSRCGVNLWADQQKRKQNGSQVLSECYIQVQFLRRHHSPAFDEEGFFGFLRGIRAEGIIPQRLKYEVQGHTVPYEVDSSTSLGAEADIEPSI